MVAGPDLNRRPSGYEADELPGCSTRLKRQILLVLVKMQILLGFGCTETDVKSAGIIIHIHFVSVIANRE